MKKIKTNLGVIYLRKTKYQKRKVWQILDSNKKEFYNAVSKNDFLEVVDILNNWEQKRDWFPTGIFWSSNLDNLWKMVNDEIEYVNQELKEGRSYKFNDIETCNFTPKIPRNELFDSDYTNQIGDTFVFYIYDYI